MEVLFGFALIVGGAWAFLRLLSWAADGRKRGWWIHDPHTRNVAQETHVNSAVEKPAFNVDGTPMNGGLDMNMKPYGFF